MSAARKRAVRASMLAALWCGACQSDAAAPSVATTSSPGAQAGAPSTAGARATGTAAGGGGLAGSSAGTTVHAGSSAAGVSGQTGGAPATAGSSGTPAAGDGSAGSGSPAAGNGAAGSGGAIGGEAGAQPTAGAGNSAAGGGAGTGSAASGVADFWDTFETISALDPARFEVVTPSCSGTGKVALDTTQGHSGTQSVRVDGAGGYCNHVFLRASALGAALPSPVYARVFLKVSMALGANHTTFMAMHDMHEDKDVRLGGQNEVLVWNRESDDATLPELSPTGVSMSQALKVNTWQCLEWMVDASGHALQTWLDGQAIAGLTLDTDPTPDVDRQWQRKTDWQPMLVDLRVGWESYGEQGNTLWFDDLAVGQGRVGCDPDASPRSP